jgi:hypothetical protein
MHWRGHPDLLGSYENSSQKGSGRSPSLALSPEQGLPAWHVHHSRRPEPGFRRGCSGFFSYQMRCSAAARVGPAGLGIGLAAGQAPSVGRPRAASAQHALPSPLFHARMVVARDTGLTTAHTEMTGTAFESSRVRSPSAVAFGLRTTATGWPRGAHEMRTRILDWTSSVE